MMKVKIIVASTRPGRKGPAVAAWVYELLSQKKEITPELLDLAVIGLPFLDEEKHPRLKEYVHEHTHAWSRMIDEADAFIVVTPEYNFGYPASLKNAFDFLYQEWNYKPVAFVSYGGVAGGTRSVQQLKQVVTALKMMPISEDVHIPAFTKHINEDGKFQAEEGLIRSAENMLKELLKWAEALSPMRKINSKN
jgi:NAD(P)H-dependent FMN reductase